MRQTPPVKIQIPLILTDIYIYIYIYVKKILLVLRVKKVNNVKLIGPLRDSYLFKNYLFRSYICFLLASENIL